MSGRSPDPASQKADKRWVSVGRRKPTVLSRPPTLYHLHPLHSSIDHTHAVSASPYLTGAALLCLSVVCASSTLRQRGIATS